MLPEQFTNRMKELLKEEYEDFAACYGNDHAHSLRINPLKGTKERYDQTSVFKQREPLKEQVAWEENGFYYEDSLQPGKHPFHEAGVYYIQEASAMAPAAICKRADPDFVNSEDAGKIGTENDTEGQREKKSSDDFRFFGERILDLCAAPGGKSTQMAAAMAGRGILFSNEIHPARARILSENIERMGIVNDIVLNHDPKVLAERFPSYFHRILVDAPCSGEGMFRKNEEAVEQWSLENVKLCAGRQEEILECAYTMLMRGGILVYSTCTFAPEEDEEMMAHFLAKHPDMKLLPVPLAGGMEPGLVRQEALMKLLQNQGQSKRKTTYDMEERFRKELQKTVRLWPHKVNGEGHFAALLQKEGTACLEVNGRKMNRDLISNMGEAPCVMRSASHSSSRDCDRKKMKKGSTFQKGKDKKSQSVSNQMMEAIAAFEQFEAQTLKSSWREGKESATYLTFGDQLYLVPEGTPDLHGLKVLRPGLHLGTFKKNRFEPSHALALSLKSKDVKDTIDLSVEDAIKYIEGYTFPAEDRKGWCLVTVEGYSLGFGKAAGGSLKNHYPKGLRKSC